MNDLSTRHSQLQIFSLVEHGRNQSENFAVVAVPGTVSNEHMLDSDDDQTILCQSYDTFTLRIGGGQTSP